MNSNASRPSATDHLRPVFQWRCGARERVDALDRLADAFVDYLELDRSGGRILRDHKHFYASETLWDALLNVLDFAADDLRERRAAR